MYVCRQYCIAYTGIDDEGSLCSCCLDCLEDVHSSFNFDPLNFSHTSDEHTTARHTITEREMSTILTYGLVEQMLRLVQLNENFTAQCRNAIML